MAALEIYLVRHGVAADRQLGKSDELRPLTEEGVARLRRSADGLDALEVKWDLFLTSPLVRAKQTAEVLATSLKSRAPIVETSTLAPSGSPAQVMKELAKHRTHSRIALFGHEPGMGELAARMLRAQEPIPFKKGAVCRIDFDAPPAEGCGALIWFATPKMLQLLGR